LGSIGAGISPVQTPFPLPVTQHERLKYVTNVINMLLLLVYMTVSRLTQIGWLCITYVDVYIWEHIKHF